MTHDVALAAGVADRLFLLSLGHRRLEPLFAGQWPGALEDPGHGADERARGLSSTTLLGVAVAMGRRCPPW